MSEADAGSQALADVHAFWFGALAPPDFQAAPEKATLWFHAPPTFDDEVRERFGAALKWARAQKWDRLDDLSPREQIGLVVLIDQFPRHMFRRTGEQFACDALALDVARRLTAGDLKRYYMAERIFLALPFEHSEDIADQDFSVWLFAQIALEARPAGLEHARQVLDFACWHRDVIRRFGRFPHRNALLGRPSTPEEIEFLRSGRGF